MECNLHVVSMLVLRVLTDMSSTVYLVVYMHGMALDSTYLQIR